MDHGTGCEQLAQLLCGLVGINGAGARQQYGKLFAADTCRQFAGTREAILQRFGHHLQALVAHGVAVGVVVELEEIHIAHQYGQRLPQTACAAEFDFLDFIEMAPVRQPGEWVATRQLFQADVGLAQLGRALVDQIGQMVTVCGQIALVLMLSVEVGRQVALQVVDTRFEQAQFVVAQSRPVEMHGLMEVGG